MSVDRELLKDIHKANGDGSREAKFAFLHQVEAVKKECSTPGVMHNFDQLFRNHSRAAVAVCLAATIMSRSMRLEADTVRWASEVLSCWTNRPATMNRVIIEDGLHPSRIEQYAGKFIRMTTL